MAPSFVIVAVPYARFVRQGNSFTKQRQLVSLYLLKSVTINAEPLAVRSAQLQRGNRLTPARADNFQLTARLA